MVLPILGLIGMGLGMGGSFMARKAQGEEAGGLLEKHRRKDGTINQLSYGRALMESPMNRKFGQSVLQNALSRQQTPAQARQEARTVESHRLGIETGQANLLRGKAAEARAAAGEGRAANVETRAQSVFEMQQDIRSNQLMRANSAEGRAKNVEQRLQKTFELQSRLSEMSIRGVEHSEMLRRQAMQDRNNLADPKQREQFMINQDYSPGMFNMRASAALGQSPAEGKEWRMTRHGLAQLPRIGSTEHIEAKKQRTTLRRFGEAMVQQNKLFQNGGSAVITGARKGELNSLNTQMTLMIKDLEDLGALQAPDIEVIEGLLPPMTGGEALVTWQTSGKQAALNAWLAGKMRASDANTEGWAGFDTMKTEFLMEEQARLRGLVDLPAEEAEQMPVGQTDPGAIGAMGGGA